MAAYEDVKAGHDGDLDHTLTHDTGNSSPDEKNELKQEKALSKIDVENSAAYKSDDSDGAVEWTIRNILASIFLCTLYTGTWTMRNAR